MAAQEDQNKSTNDEADSRTLEKDQAKTNSPFKSASSRTIIRGSKGLKVPFNSLI